MRLPEGTLKDVAVKQVEAVAVVLAQTPPAEEEGCGLIVPTSAWPGPFQAKPDFDLQT